MSTLSRASETNASFSPSYDTPVAIFVGGTSGIGQAMAEGFARYTKGNAHIIIIGRNREAAQASIESFPKPTSTTFTHEFVQCDASLMKNVQETTSSLLARLPKVNFLVMSTGIFILGNRNETVEGIDEKMALGFYARAKFTSDLMPLLQKAADAGEDAKVYSVLAAGQGGKIDLDDLGLKKHHSVMGCAIAVSTYTDLFMEKQAQDHPNVAFTHAFPGFVRSPMMKPSHWALKPFYPLLLALMYPFSVTPQASAEYQLSALFNAKPGFTSRGPQGQQIDYTPGSKEAIDKFWQHTEETIHV